MDSHDDNILAKILPGMCPESNASNKSPTSEIQKQAFWYAESFVLVVMNREKTSFSAVHVGWRLIIWSDETGSAVSFRVSRLILHNQGESQYGCSLVSAV